MPPSTIWHIPYQRNPYFTGREDVLSQLHRTLHTENTVALSDPQGISGLGGIGKTQTVLEYAYRYRTDYDAVFWVRADSVASLTSSLVELAYILELPERYEQDQEIIVQAVLRWFRLHTDWLLIYDNIDDLSIAEPFLPKAGPGHLLFTTRAHAFGELAQRLDIQKMEPEIGALLLLRRASLLAIQATLNMANADDQTIARTISQELDGLPLALDQAGAYIKEAPCSLPDYQTRYQTRHSDLLQERGHFNQNYPASVATTWSLSFERVGQTNLASAELLNFCAFLAPDVIPETMITKGALHLPPMLHKAVINDFQFDQVIAVLLNYSLVHRSTSETLGVHRLVQTVVRDAMPPEAALQWKKRTVLAVNTASPVVEDVEQWNMCEQWVPHALVCSQWIDEERIEREEAVHLLNQAGYYLHERARYGYVERILKQALLIAEQQGANHPNTASSLNNLAGYYENLGRYKEAEPLHKRALSIREKHLGVEHPETATSLNNLATLHKSLGRYKEAEPLHKRALSIREKHMGAEHPETATSLNNLALLYQLQGRYKEAELFYKRALSIREQQLGVAHPKTATTLNNLAGLYKNQGKYAQAELLVVRALAIIEQHLGAEHPRMASSMNNLALLYLTQSRYEEALALYKRALSIYEQQLGAEHPDTATSLNNLAGIYESLGKYEEALPLYQQALLISEKLLGGTHPDTATSLNNLAGIYESLGKYEEALPLYQQALSIYEEQLGAIHPNTATALNNLALVYQRLGRYGDAEPLYKRALSIRKERLGVEHPETVTSLNNLALLYLDQNRYEDAEPLLKQAFSIREQRSGAEHPDTATSLNNLAHLYQRQGRYGEAEPLYKQALSIREQRLGAEHPDTAISLNNLAALYKSQGEYAQAKPLYVHALAIFENILGQNHPNTQKVRANYTSLLQAMERDGEAK